MNKDNSFKVGFNSSQNNFGKVKFMKTGGMIEKFKAEVQTSKPEDIYYDEIIYYDGGGVEGYGD